MIAIIIGTRAELIKAFPVMLELKKRDIEYTFIHTGQHDLGDLVRTFGVKEPDVVLTPRLKVRLQSSGAGFLRQWHGTWESCLKLGMK